MAQLRLLMDRGLERTYFPELAKLFFIANNLEYKEATRREFRQVGLYLAYVDGSR